MPIIQVYLRKQDTSPEYRAGIAASIRQAMIDPFKVPDDDYFQVTHEVKPENMVYDRNYFGVPRGEDAVFIVLTFNHRPPEPKHALFAAIVDNLGQRPGIERQDIYMNITEVAPENWWVHARTVNPETGTDSRLNHSLTS